MFHGLKLRMLTHNRLAMATSEFGEHFLGQPTGVKVCSSHWEIESAMIAFVSHPDVGLNDPPSLNTIRCDP